MRTIIVFSALLALAVLVPVTAQQGFTGRWNITGTGEDANRVYWLEVTEQGGQLSGKFLNRTGSPLTLASIKVENGTLKFQLPPGRDNKPGLEVSATLQGDKLIGSHVQAGRTINWVGVRRPVFPAANASGKHSYGTPVPLFDGTSYEAFNPQSGDKVTNWAIEDGVLTNSPPSSNLMSKQKFKDFRIQAEYKVAQGSNSGIYLRGRYELQVLDDFGKPTESHGHMAIYAWTPPLVNASKPAGEWQTLDAVLVGNRLTATLNGQKVHDNAEIQAITGGALDADELAPGPLLVQGDHAKVWFRKIVVTPIQ